MVTQSGHMQSEKIGLAAVRAEIARACREARRDPASVTLIAVSKTFGADAILPVIAQGHRVFGENRVQEAKAKWPALLARYGRVERPALLDVSGLPLPERGRLGEEVFDPHPTASRSTSPFQGEVKKDGVELHMVGPLQSNKARDAVALFDAIHSLDRASLCEALAKEIARQGRRPTLFVEINTGGEAQKAGVLPQDADAFIARCRETYGLRIDGLMCIPPLDEAPAPHFALTAKIAARNGLTLLSMGMSADYPIAIAFGATHVRIGTAIFGARK
jgi:uncharacterized pyridoxal phosphate-containing UPF0001 family protein